MNKFAFLLIFLLICIYFVLIYGEEQNHSKQLNSEEIENRIITNNLLDARKKHKYGLHKLSFWGWPALAVAFWIKVKLVIVAFFLGSAVFWGMRYFWPHKCPAEIIKDSPIYYDHAPSYSHHHYDSVPYALGATYESASPSFDSTYSHEPYSAYAESYGGQSPTAAEKHQVYKRSLKGRQRLKMQYMPTEEQIAEMMFMFLGLDSQSCRRRFICEMEFRARRNPLTSMAFRIVGRGFFEKYINARNANGRARDFEDCARVNADCKVIEEHFVEEAVGENETTQMSLENTTVVHHDDGIESNELETDTNENTINVDKASISTNEVKPQQQSGVRWRYG